LKLCLMYLAGTETWLGMHRDPQHKRKINNDINPSVRHFDRLGTS
jgi:hypothetical protein